MDLTSTKILVAVLFGILRFFFGILPVKLYKLLLLWEGEDDGHHFVNKRRHEQVTCALALCQSFGGGVLFATCFLHMMPDVYKSVEELKNYGNVTTDYPLSQLTVSLGFFFVYFVEEFTHWVVTRVPDDEGFCDKSPSKPVSPASNQVVPKSAFIIEEEVYKEIKEKDAISQCSQCSVTTEVMKENEKNEKNGENILDLDELEKKVEEEIEKQVKSKQQIMRYVLMVVALSLHSFFEGLAIGLQKSNANIWYLFIAVSVHSATILFYISLELILAKTEMNRILIHVTTLALTSPVGVLLGLLITRKTDMNTQAKSAAIVLLEGLSSGTILYITFFEVLNREKERRAYTLLRAICILGGFVLMAVLQCAEVYIE